MKIFLIFDNFIFFIKRIHYELLNITENRYLVKPCQVGKGKRSVSLTLPSDLTRKLRLDPTGALFLPDIGNYPQRVLWLNTIVTEFRRMEKKEHQFLPKLLMVYRDMNREHQYFDEPCLNNKEDYLICTIYLKL